MGRRTLTGILLLGMAAAACGGGAGETPGVTTPGATQTATSTATSTAAPTSASSGTATPTATASPTSSGSAAAVAPAPVEMKLPVGTAMAGDLQALGLDPKNLPPLAKLEPRTLRGVMKLFARSLGIKCGDCHAEGDFAAPTPRKKIATHMWNDFAAKLTMQDGSPVFCDSCHQGRIKLLDRSDKKALGKWMDVAFVQPVARKDGRTQQCENCHVDWNMTFLSDWAR